MSLFHRKVQEPERVKTRVLVIQQAPQGVSLHGTYVSHAELYRSSPSVRACVNFLASHVARYHVQTMMVDADGERPIEKDRVRALFADPAPGISRFQLIEHLVTGVILSGNAYAPLIVDGEGRVRGITPTGASVSLERVQSGPPVRYLLQTGAAEPVRVAPENMLHVRAASSSDPWLGQSPLESMQGLLAEERAATAARELMWRKGLVRDGIIEVDPLSKADGMGDEAAESFLIDLEDALSPSDKRAARPAMLIPGMRWKDSAFTPRELEYSEARNQTLRLVCGILNVPPQLVGAESRQSRVAYRELETALAPWVNRIESAVNAQLVPGVYGDQAAGGRLRARLLIPAPVTDQELGATLDGAVKAGRMTPNEARAVTGLPAIAGGDTLVPPPGSMPA